MKEIKTMLQSLDTTVKVLEKKLNKQESQQQGYKQNKTGGYKGNYNNSKPRYQNDTQRYSSNPRYQKPYSYQQNQGFRQPSPVYQAYPQFENTPVFQNQYQNVIGEKMLNTFCPGRGSNQDLLCGSQTLYRVAIKAGLYRKAVQVCIYLTLPHLFSRKSRNMFFFKSNQIIKWSGLKRMYNLCIVKLPNWKYVAATDRK